MSKSLLWSACLGFALTTTGAFASTSNVELDDKLNAAANVLHKITQIPEKSIPPALLRSAKGLALIPGLIKAGFVVGGSYGKGVLLVHNASGGWSPPVFIRLAAGSLGWQIGAESTDVVLVFKTQRSVQGLVHGTFTLGADAAVAAGPVGRTGEAATDAELKAEILSYSRSRGLFAGISLQGSKISVDYDADEAFYGKGVRTADILAGKVAVPASAEKLLQTVSEEVSPK
jgi:lipid-binding SYLF domain-containing protein